MHLPLKEHAVDKIAEKDMIFHHLGPQRKKIAEQYWRVLRPGGKALMFVTGGCGGLGYSNRRRINYDREIEDLSGVLRRQWFHVALSDGICLDSGIREIGEFAGIRGYRPLDVLYGKDHMHREFFPNSFMIVATKPGHRRRRKRSK